MAPTRFESTWKTFKGHARERRGKLTNDDVQQVQGKRERLVARIQTVYQESEEEAGKRVDAWIHDMEQLKDHPDM